jgi:hypothetical protein
VTSHDAGSLWSCDAAVFVDESAKDVGSFDVLKGRDFRQRWSRRHGRLQVHATVWSGDVVVLDVLGQNPFEMMTTEDQSPVQTLGPNRAHPPVGCAVIPAR